MKDLYVHCPLHCVCVCVVHSTFWSVKSCDQSVSGQTSPLQQWTSAVVLFPYPYHIITWRSVQHSTTCHTTITIVISCWALSVAHDDSSLSPSPSLLTVGTIQHCSTHLSHVAGGMHHSFLLVWSGNQYLLPCRLGDGLPAMIMEVARQSASQLCCCVCNIGWLNNVL